MKPREYGSWYKELLKVTTHSDKIACYLHLQLFVAMSNGLYYVVRLGGLVTVCR